MRHADIRAALEPFARLRMREIQPEGDLGNGTPLCDAAASLLAADLARLGVKAARRPEETVADVSDEQLRACVETVRELVLASGGESRTLPSGTVVGAGYNSGLSVGTTSLVPVRGRPGLHDYGSWQAMPDEPGARAMREAVAAAMAKTPEMDVPRVTADDVVIRHDHKHRDTLCVPMRGGPGVVYMDEDSIAPVETLLDIEIALIASTAAGKARDVWDEREEIDEAFKATMDEIEPVVAKAREQGLPVRIAGVTVRRGLGNTTVTPRIEVLGNDLKPATWSPFVGSGTTLAKVVENQMGVQRRRKRILDQADERGGRGRVDRVTLAAIRAYADDPDDVLRRMATNRRLTVREGGAGRTGGPVRALRPGERQTPLRLSWRNGRVEASFKFNDDLSWQQGTLMVKRTSFPQTVLDLLPGKPLSTLLDHPFVSPGDTIRSVRPPKQEGGYVYFNVDTSWTTFDAETGRVAD